MNFERIKDYVPSTLTERNLRKLPKCNRRITLNLRNVLAGSGQQSTTLLKIEYILSFF